MEECSTKDMNLYQSPRKAETGLGSDRLPQGLREFTLAEIKSSVVEAGKSHEALASGNSQNEILKNPNTPQKL